MEYESTGHLYSKNNKAMKRVIFMLSLLLCNTLFAQVDAEMLSFELKFGFLKGGEVVYQTRLTATDDRKEIHAFLHGYTTGFAKTLYGVDDQYESYINAENLLPNKSFKKLHEKDFRLLEEVTYNQDEGTATCKRSGKHTVEKGICDISSLMYNIRYSGKLDHLIPSQVIDIPFWDTNEWYILKLKYAGTEKIETCLGEVDCMRLEPQGITGRFFKKTNPMNVWVTNDSKKLPVLMELNFTIGSVKCQLKKVTPSPSEGEASNYPT